MKKVTIYGLEDPITKEIRYVGKTVQNPKNRLSSHKCRNRNIYNHTEAWVKSLKSKNVSPELLIIDVVDFDSWEFWEQFYIAYFKTIGCRLTNSSIGGESCNLGSRWKLTNEQKLKLKGRAGKPIVLLNKDGSFYKSFPSGISASLFLGLNSQAVCNAIGKKDVLVYISPYLK